jgi:hypothetical protein
VDTIEIALWQTFSTCAEIPTAGCCKAERSRQSFYQLYDLRASVLQSFFVHACLRQAVIGEHYALIVQ